MWQHRNDGGGEKKNFCLYIFTKRGDSFKGRLRICTKKGLVGQVGKIDF